MTATVSVAICTHNGAKYVEQQLRSILDQSLLPDEIVLSDDASTDDTVAIAREILGSKQRGGGPTVTTLRNREALGVRGNFEQAMRACTSELIALCDQDDVWHSDRLGVSVAMFESHSPPQLVFSDARLVDGDGEPLGHSLFEALAVNKHERDAISGDDGFAALLRRNLVTGATTMVTRELLSAALPFPEHWVHDEWLAIIAAATGRIDCSPAELIDYRQHGANQIGVRKLGPAGKARRLIEPRDGRNVYLLERATILLERLVELGTVVDPHVLELAREKVAHQRARASLATGRLRRFIPVLREVRTGRYASFSRGGADIVRDLVQPVGVESHAAS